VWNGKRTGEAGKSSQAIVHLKPLTALVLLGASGILFSGIAFVLKHYTDSPVPFGDALTTARSMVATWMLAQKIIEQWWVWLFVNILSAALYTWRGLYPTAFLFCCYAVASVIGYYAWKKTDALRTKSWLTP
jgi:nicotinamide mononucleotide transporter